MGLLKNNEWDQFKKAITLALKSSDWTASFDGLLWSDNDRKPAHNQEIFVKLAPRYVQVFVSGIQNRSTTIIQLQLGREWEQLQNWMKNEFPDPEWRWSATVNGRTWEDNSWAPTRDQTIRANMKNSHRIGWKNRSFT
jgi:hypothetical protein